VKRRDLLPALGLVAVALVTAVSVVLVSSLGGEEGRTSPSLAPDIDPGSAAPRGGGGLPARGIEAQAALEPRITLFGDMVVAHVDVLLDRRKVDPASVRVGTEFLPWEIVGQPVRARQDAIRFTRAVRREVESNCVPDLSLPAATWDQGPKLCAPPVEEGDGQGKEG